jgi:hypothetical protein
MQTRPVHWPSWMLARPFVPFAHNDAGAALVGRRRHMPHAQIDLAGLVWTTTLMR